MKLIINSDDFGLSKSISDGIIEGIKGLCLLYAWFTKKDNAIEILKRNIGENNII